MWKFLSKILQLGGFGGGLQERQSRTFILNSLEEGDTILDSCDMVSDTVTVDRWPDTNRGIRCDIHAHCDVFNLRRCVNILIQAGLKYSTRLRMILRKC